MAPKLPIHWIIFPPACPRLPKNVTVGGQAGMPLWAGRLPKWTPSLMGPPAQECHYGRAGLFLLCVLFLIPLYISPEIVILKDGSKHIGSIEDQTNTIKITTKYGVLTVKKDDVKIIYPDIQTIIDKIKTPIKKAKSIIDNATHMEDLVNRTKELENAITALKEAQTIGIENADVFSGGDTKVFNELMTEINQIMKYARSLMVTQKDIPVPQHTEPTKPKQIEIKNYPCLYCYGSPESICVACQGAGALEMRCETCYGKGYCPYCKGTTQTTCATCGGAGYESFIGGPNGFHNRPCRRCQGQKLIQCNKCLNMPGRCSRCEGKGTVPGKKCGVCEGAGRVICKVCLGAGGFSTGDILNKSFNDILIELNNMAKTLEGVEGDIKYSHRRKIDELWAKEYSNKIVSAEGILQNISSVNLPDKTSVLCLQVLFTQETTIFFCGTNQIDSPTDKIKSIGGVPLKYLKFVTTQNWRDNLGDIQIEDRIRFFIMLPKEIRKPIVPLTDNIPNETEFNKILLLDYQPKGSQITLPINPPLSR